MLRVLDATAYPTLWLFWYGRRSKDRHFVRGKRGGNEDVARLQSVGVRAGIGPDVSYVGDSVGARVLRDAESECTVVLDGEGVSRVVERGGAVGLAGTDVGKDGFEVFFGLGDGVVDYAVLVRLLWIWKRRSIVGLLLM